MSRMLDGRDEPIIDPGLPIIDAHHHLYERAELRYMFDDYLADVSAGHHILASVYVESKTMARQNGPEVLRPLGEIEFANGVAAMSASGRYGPCRVAAAIVGFADLTQGDSVADLLDRAMSCAPERFRGVRMVTLETTSTEWLRYVFTPPSSSAGILGSTAFREGFRHLGRRHLAFDASIFHTQMSELGELAAEYPDTTIILNHMGLAIALGLDQGGALEVFEHWRRGLRKLAQHPNVVCKVGGLGLPFWGFALENRPDAVGAADLAALWRPYVETAIEAFGVNRCIMESNFPPDGRSCGYVPLWNALKLITGTYALHEKLALFRDNAARVYRIDLSTSV